MLRPTALLLLLLLRTCAAATEDGLEEEEARDRAAATSAQLIAAMGPMAAQSPQVSRQGRQFGRRLSSHLQSQLSLRSPQRAPVYIHSPSVVSISAPTTARGPPAAPTPVSSPIGPPGTFSSGLSFASPPGPLSLPSPPSPPAPLVVVAPPSPPAPVTVAPPAPSPPPTSGTVAPPSDGGVQATNIQCLQSSSREQLTASLVSTRPLVAPPVLTLRPAVNPLSSAVCAVTSSQDGRRLELAVTNLEACGVESCVQPNGERWLCLTMRFPLIAGLHLPEDDVIQIQCRPQDPSQTAGKQLLVQATGSSSDASGRTLPVPRLVSFESLSPVLFSGGRQEFECEIALFRRTPGSDMFSTVVTAGDTITLGEELHLRSIIRGGDGWQYSKLTDVLVERVSADAAALPSDSAPLVFSDGCRNRDLILVAPEHPARHQTNQLISNFAFRVFTFQGMASGDSLQISARVTGCVEAIDCAPTACPDGGQGFGRRRRDARLEGSNTTDWRRNLAFSVVIPDTPHVLSPRPVPAAAAPPESVVTVAAVAGGCPASLLASLIAALAGCLLLLTTAVCLLNARQRRRLQKARRQPPQPERQQRCGGGHPHHECGVLSIDGSVGVGWPAVGPPHWPLEGAITAPRGRCTERRLKRRRADVRRSFSAGSLRCECAAREGKEVSGETVRQRDKVNVSIVRVPAQENIYSEPKPRWDVAPTMV